MDNLVVIAREHYAFGYVDPRFAYPPGSCEYDVVSREEYLEHQKWRELRWILRGMHDCRCGLTGATSAWPRASV